MRGPAHPKNSASGWLWRRRVTIEEAYDQLREQSVQLVQAEDQLRRADRLAIVGELSAGMAHEIRNPLGSIKGTAEIFRDSLPAEHKLHEFAGILVKEKLFNIAATNGVRLWDFATASGIGVQRSFSYLLPYLLHPENWKKQQISKFSADGTVWPGLAGVGLQPAQLLEAYRTLPRGNSPWVQFVDLVVSAG